MIKYSAFVCDYQIFGRCVMVRDYQFRGVVFWFVLSDYQISGDTSTVRSLVVLFLFSTFWVCYRLFVVWCCCLYQIFGCAYFVCS